jgi:hypothetical protein
MPDDLRDRIARAMREHHIDTTRHSPDRHNPCVCGGWWDDPMSEDWDTHLADAVLTVRDTELERLREIELVTAPPVDMSDELPADPAEARELWDFVTCSWRWQGHMARKFAANADRLRADLAKYKSALNWQTTCLTCSKALTAAYDADMRAERAEADRDRYRAAWRSARARAQRLRTAECGPMTPGDDPMTSIRLRDLLAMAELASRTVHAEQESSRLREQLAVAEATLDRMRAAITTLDGDAAAAEPIATTEGAQETSGR